MRFKSTYLSLIIITMSIPAIWSKVKKKKKEVQQPTKISEGVLRTILDNKEVYVDKTGFILQLLNSPDHYYFISRPRKFGKSLLLNTIKEICLGNRELFNGREIYDKYDWSKYPVLSFNFSTPNKKPNAKMLEKELDAEISLFGKANNVTGGGENFHERLKNSLQSVYNSTGAKTVVLVDEYDFAVNHNEEDPDTAQQCAQILKLFFHALENAQIKFMFITGISLTTLTSIWSNSNKVLDITTDPRYSALLGYTADEYKTNFDAHIQNFVEVKNVTEEFIHEKMQIHYNGYRFSKENNSVYNPRSVRKYLDEMVVKNFVIDLGTPAFLIQQIWRRHREAVSLLLTSRVDLRILQIRYDDPYKVPLMTLLFQTGYLTIRDYDNATNRCEIDFPNEEVRETFIKCLITEFGAIGWESVMEERKTIRGNLEKAEIRQFVKNFQREFHRMLYLLVKLSKEDVFGLTVRTVLSLCTVKSIEMKEVPLALGRYDFVSVLPKVFYIFELQTIPGVNFTMNSMEIAEYRRKYSGGCEKSVVIGLNYDESSCLIEEWRAVVYENDKKVTELSPISGMYTDDPDLSDY